ncbi:Mu-like prophage protein gp16 [Rhizobium sp. RU35A]|uniref:regulatory protein GemA n=1 Tax=Rhizobium sp. RU35A TaxID=1907414 RepID=UPI000953E043|nr:regulatory protein GemA [Rhizobium sp. RU35A]SIP88930.1 Mu-like prophage protein gp16 [Rhizobium sp. RU35A]
MTSSTTLINIARTKLGLDEDTYRAKLQVITGKSSLRAMTEPERQKVIETLRREGFDPATSPSKAISGKYAKRLQALWIAGYNLGVIHDRRDSAMLAFVKAQTGLDHVRFLHQTDDATSAIEALKAWLKREAGVMFGNTNGQEWLAGDGAKIAWAQWKILHPEANLMVRKGFDAEVSAIVGRQAVWLADLKPKEWQMVMNALGRRVRARKGAK